MTRSSEDHGSETDTNGSTADASFSSRGPRGVARNRKVQYRFWPETDELLAKLVLEHNPYQADHGEVGLAWTRVANAMGVNVDGRRCRERIKLLVNNRKLRVRDFERTGRVEEAASLIDRLLDEIIVLQETGRAGVEDRIEERVELEDEKEERDDDDEIESMGAAEMMRSMGKRKAVDDSALLAYFHARLEADTEIKRLKLDLESRRLRLEEKRQEMAERKTEIESQERVAMINLLAGMSTRLFGAPAPPE